MNLITFSDYFSILKQNLTWTFDVKFAWIGCMFKMIFVSLTIMLYIYIHTISELMTWNLHELVAFQIIFGILEYDDIYIYIQTHFSEQMTWKLHKFGCISDHFCILQNTDICIYIHIFENKLHEICMNWLHVRSCLYLTKSDIYIYTYLISERLITCHVFLFGYPRFVWFQGSEVPSLTRFPRWG